ncbi:MAG: SH3-like domain-containing protein [Pirellulales bacterium]
MSGPPAVGEYRTERMERGQRVTVYRAERGWCAVRPPRGAFSWVEGKFLQPTDDRTARVVVDQIPCYVGSQMVDKRDRSQITLKAGEMVEVLGVTETAGGTWYQVAPPSGEFRWIAAADLRRDPPSEWPAGAALSLRLAPCRRSALRSAARRR